MAILGRTCRWRWLALVCGMLLLVLPGSAGAAGTAGPRPASASSEPFGLAAAMLVGGGVREKWLQLEQALEQDGAMLDSCRDDLIHCPSSEALQLLAIIDSASPRDGLARLGEINRAINLAIRPASDRANHGVADQWSSPLATLAAGSGDCEDYAIAKLVALKRAGMAADDLRLVIVRDPNRSEDHALLAARLDGTWIMLDNRRMIMLRDFELAGYRPTLIMSDRGVNAYLEDAPSPALSRAPDAAEAARELAMLSFGLVSN